MKNKTLIYGLFAMVIGALIVIGGTTLLTVKTTDKLTDKTIAKIAPKPTQVWESKIIPAPKIEVKTNEKPTPVKSTGGAKKETKLQTKKKTIKPSQSSVVREEDNEHVPATEVECERYGTCWDTPITHPSMYPTLIVDPTSMVIGEPNDEK